MRGKARRKTSVRKGKEGECNKENVRIMKDKKGRKGRKLSLKNEKGGVA